MSSSSSAKIFAFGIATGVGVCAILSSWKKRRRRRPAPRRFGGAIKLKENAYDRYTQLHDAVWDGVLDRMYQSNMRNFTLYYHRETSTLFSHFEWVGHWYRQVNSPEEEKALFDADMNAVAADPVVRLWWIQCEPCQQPFSQWLEGSRPLSEGGQGDWWAPLVCLNHCGHWPTEFSDGQRDPDFVPQNPNGDTSSQPKPLSDAKLSSSVREQ